MTQRVVDGFRATSEDCYDYLCPRKTLCALNFQYVRKKFNLYIFPAILSES